MISIQIQMADDVYARTMAILAKHQQQPKRSRPVYREATDVDTILKIVRELGPVLKRDITRKTQWMDAVTRNGILYEMVQSGQIELVLDRPRTYKVV